MRVSPAPFIRCGAAPSAAILASLVLVGQAHAAGGHHAVDDAALLAPGECQLEAWFERASGGARRLLHAGPACRVGAVELGLNLDRSRTGGAGDGSTALSGGAQLKWAQPLGKTLAGGVVVSVTAQEGPTRFAGSTVVLPLTWYASPTVQVHLNLGRDFRHQAPDTSRAGAALEWAPGAQWSFVGERFREAGANFQRVGARYALSPALQADLSRTWGRDGAPDSWTAGVNWVFVR
ncbi:MAG: hypothetical protein V4562_04555 [Pseudomonadota bacterium]